MVTLEAAQEATKEWGQSDIRIPKSYAGFPLGLKTSQDPRAVPVGAATTLQNLLFERRGMLRYIGGSNVIWPTDVIAEFFRYYRAPQGVYDEIRRLIAAKFNGFTSSIISIDESSSSGTTVFTNLSLLYPSDACMLEVDGAIFCTQRDKRMLVSYDAITWVESGFLQPIGTGFIALDAGFAGNLDSSGTGVPYTWAYVFRDANGNFSNPTTTTASLQLDLRAAKFTMYDIDTPTVASGEISFIDIYRIGGTSSEWRLAKTFVPSAVSGMILDSATGVAPVDNTADINLSDTLISFNRNPPPRGLLKIVHHGSRIFAAGQSYDSDVTEELVSPSRLWVSRLNEPTAWGQDDNGVDDDGGVIDIDGNDIDWIYDMASTGSVLLIGRAQSVYALTGSGFQTYIPTKISSIGVASRHSMVREGNIVYFLGSDGILYMVTDTDPAPLTDPIQSILDAIPTANLSSAVLWAHNRRLFLSIPLDSGQLACYFMDLHYRVPGDSTGPFSWTLAYGWGQMTDSKFRVNQARTIYPYGVGDPTVVPQGTGRPQCFVAPTGGGIYEVLDPDTATSTPIGVESPYLYFGDPLGDKGEASTDIEGCLTEFMLTGQLSFSVAPVVTFTFLQADNTTIGFNLPVRMATGVKGKLLWIPSFPESCSGIAVKWKVTGSITAGIISSAFLRWMPLRSEW